MNRTAWLLPPLAITLIAGAAVLGTGLAAGSTVLPQRAAKATVTPQPPVVNGQRGKHGLDLAAARRLEKERWRVPPPPKGAPDDGPKKTRPRGGRTVQDPEVEARRPFRFHAAGCKPTEMEGKVLGPNECGPEVPDPPDEPRASRQTLPPRVVRPQPQDVRWEQVLAETKSVVFPGLRVKVQPAGRTLVNLDTIVYTDDSKISSTTATLLGFPVIVEATPISYTWNFGDGTPALTTGTPGEPYPAKDITHKYMKRGAVSLTLTTNYAARFNVADTGWQYINGTIPITGPATPLQVREAVPVLVDPGR